MDSLVLQDPVAYTPLPSAPPADTVVTVRPEILTIRLVSPAPVAENRKWLAYCCFIIIVISFGLLAFYYMMFGAQRKN